MSLQVVEPWTLYGCRRRRVQTGFSRNTPNISGVVCELRELQNESAEWVLVAGLTDYRDTFHYVCATEDDLTAFWEKWQEKEMRMVEHQPHFYKIPCTMLSRAA